MSPLEDHKTDTADCQSSVEELSAATATVVSVHEGDQQLRLESQRDFGCSRERRRIVQPQALSQPHHNHHVLLAGYHRCFGSDLCWYDSTCDSECR